MPKKEKLAVWGISLVNPLLGWAVTYLLWHETNPEKQRYGARAAVYTFSIVIVFFMLAIIAGLASPK
ncbi:MAG: hypothetical protein HYS57_00640 [Parcubacteria group bacterium]|nr:hypothetical protein [Parcubacteria group bacterium]